MDALVRDGAYLTERVSVANGVSLGRTQERGHPRLVQNCNSKIKVSLRKSFVRHGRTTALVRDLQKPHKKASGFTSYVTTMRLKPDRYWISFVSCLKATGIDVVAGQKPQTPDNIIELNA
jgi:hypothetical protein